MAIIGLAPIGAQPLKRGITGHYFTAFSRSRRAQRIWELRAASLPVALIRHLTDQRHNVVKLVRKS
jgi:hypothetical protein